MGTSLYAKHRPRSMEYVVGASAARASITSLLARPANARPHALLFVGPSGCGKTTLARIWAKAVGAKGGDIQELNIADFRGIDTVRDLAARAGYRPMHSEARVVILDELHSMTTDAQNALLKLLEDPPEHLYFVLCTTNPEKLLKTIVTRCTTIEMAALSEDNLVAVLQRVVKKEGKKVADSVLATIAQHSDGSARQAISILERVLDLPVKEQEDAAVQVATNTVEGIEICRALVSGKEWAVVAPLLKDLAGDPEKTRRAILGYAQSVLLGCKGRPAPIHNRCFLIIKEFSPPLYDTGKPGLTAMCFAACTSS